MITATDTKTCNKCQQELPTYEFDKKGDTRDGLNNTCKECRRAARGSAKRLPMIRSYEEITTEVLIEDIHAEARRRPSNWRVVAASRALKNNPDDLTNEKVANILYDMWERRMRNQHDFTRLDETCPVENERTIRRRKALAASLDIYCDMEII